MREKTKWAASASVVKKHLQACCKHAGTLSLETVERDDTSDGCESPPHIQISSPIKETALPSLFRRKSFNVPHVRSLLTTLEAQTPYRKSVESALPLCGASTFKPARLQYARSSPNLAAAAAAAPSPSPPEAPKAEVLHKSGPLPVLQHSSKGGNPGGDHFSPVQVKKHFSGPLPSIPSKPLSGMPSPGSPAKAKLAASGPSSSGGKPKQLVAGGPSPNRLTKVKSSQGLFPAVATSKLPGMVTQGTLKKAAQIATAKVKQQITPVLDRKNSRGSRASKIDCNPPAPIPMEKTPAKTPTKALVSDVECLGNETGKSAAVAQCARLDSRNGRRKSIARERDEIWAAVKIQAAFRGYRTRKKFVFERSTVNPSGELTEELDEAHSVSTRMSKTDPQKRKKAPPQVCKSWNGSIRTAQDCQALLRSKQEAALKRERAMEYALSRQHWKTGSRSLKGPIWSTDDRLPDKPGWVWSWLERAARMDFNSSQNRIFDDNSTNNDPQSESLSVKSTVGMCTTDIGSLDMDLGWPQTDPWPLSLRQQHAAGLLQPKTPQAAPSPLQKAAGTPETPLQRSVHCKNGDVPPFLVKRHHRDELQEHFRREDVSTTADSCISSPTSEESSDHRPRYGVRKLKFLNDDVHNDGEESVGSCVGALPTLYRLSSPFAGPKVTSNALQHKLSNSNSLKDANRAHPPAQGQTQAHHTQAQVSVALSDSDSAGTTAASVRRPFWRP